ncbi:MAG: hypothetical protein GT598_15620 [Bacteroidales bacterium]|nr:hypothetical protein [Bacteroidales bacterium]
MGKFTLLTTLTLAAAGYEKGIDKAKKSAKALGDGVKSAGKTMTDALKPMGGIIDGVSDQLGGIPKVITGGVSAFKAMIPAINGVKIALITSGIGAIVVALGTAFAALTTYLKGTEEGSMKLHKVLGYIKGAFNALLVRVQLLGEAISLVFEGRFKEAGMKLKEAFAGGLLEEIKEDANEMAGYAERENKLLLDKRALTEQEAKLKLRISELDLKIYNKENDANERYKALQEVKASELSLMKEKLRIAQEEYDIVKSQNEMSKSGTKDIDKEVELKNRILDIQREYNEIILSYIRKENEINNLLKKQVEITRELPIPIADTGNLLKNVSFAVSNIDNTKLVEMKNTAEEIKKPLTDLEIIIGNMLPSAVVSLTDAFGEFLSGTEGGFKNLITTVLQGIKQVLNALLAEAIAGMLAGEAKKGIIGLITGAIGVSALLALWQSKVPQFASGGIVSAPTLAMVGEYPSAKSNPEVIAPLDKLQKLIGGGYGGGEVTFKIQGTELVGVLNNQNRKINSYR